MKTLDRAAGPSSCHREPPIILLGACEQLEKLRQLTTRFPLLMNRPLR